MEPVRTSKTSVYFNETEWRYIPEGRRQNLKSQGLIVTEIQRGPCV
jgi:hypothetical protein